MQAGTGGGMQIKGISQSSPKWIRARVGHITASRMGDLMKKRQDMKRSKKCADYLDELVLERLHGYAETHDVTKDMLRGIELQPAAAAAYEIERGVLL